MIESEKVLERKLGVQVKNLKGYCFKLLPFIINGLPDRICLFPGGRVLFVELKTTKQKTRGIQTVWHNRLRKLGFRVEVIDNSKYLKEVIDDFKGE